MCFPSVMLPPLNGGYRVEIFRVSWKFGVVLKDTGIWRIKFIRIRRDRNRNFQVGAVLDGDQQSAVALFSTISTISAIALRSLSSIPW